MYISVHEWPLPDEKNEAIAVVFELHVPTYITDWRCLTLLLQDLLLGDRALYRGRQNLHSPSSYSELKDHMVDKDNSRMQLSSKGKPFTDSHYGKLRASEADQGKLCPGHGCRYSYYDSALGIPTSSKASIMAIPPNCSLANLSPRESIARMIRGYSNSSNQVIAWQSDCPPGMTLESFKAYGHIRSGHRLQWKNVLAQLHMPLVDFNQVETALVILQAINEAGPCVDDSSNQLRDSHRVLHDESFACRLFEAIRTAFCRIEGNWN